MGLLTQEIMELREMRDAYNKGNMSTEKLHSNILVFSQTEKRERDMINLFGLMAKSPPLTQSIMRSRLLDSGESLQLVDDRESEEIECRELKKTITRAECLDYSGSHKKCSGCPEKGKTNDLLLEPYEKGSD